MYLRVKLRRDPMEKEFSRYQTKIGPAFAEAANEMYDGTRPPAGHGQWGCACRRHSQEDGCCCAAGRGLARCAQNPGCRGGPGGAGEKQPEGRGVLQALARSGPGTRSTHPRGATASTKGQIPGLCGRAGLTPVPERSDRSSASQVLGLQVCSTVLICLFALFLIVCVCCIYVCVCACLCMLCQCGHV